MQNKLTDDELCHYLTEVFKNIFPHLTIIGGAEEPYYSSPKEDSNAAIYYRSDYPRSLLHEMAHYCLAGGRRRNIDDFGYWYSPCGRTQEEQKKFELVEARPQGLEKAMCQIVGIRFSASIDDFSGRPPSDGFLLKLDHYYNQMLVDPPLTAKKALNGLKEAAKGGGVAHDIFNWGAKEGRQDEM